ncbi:MAG TPA: PfkB family carbohydrate kinase [Anaerohalosphaeraceae bacterium]|jgi:ribokinase|nr:PfkB family carbohydrate kinase [Anaerohalosphaeraceae bacterium]HRT51578.1 PfkB family carbohydrate kinase [Anaerohalosphaeraceae bacterium]HRT87587.1 PfkB family carbohydrate kinase [Anaerohalosphaeraceae bacterium]
MTGRIPRVVVVGPTYVDMVIKCKEFPRPGSTVDGFGASCVPTGAGPNRAVEAALCDCEVALISKVGEDPFGEMAKANLRRFRINTELLYTASAMSTGVIMTMVDSTGENLSCISAGANRALSADEIGCAAAESLISAADVCLICGDLPQEAVVTAIRTAELHRTRVILETPPQDHGITRAADLNWPVEYYDADVLIPNFYKLTEGAELGAGSAGELKLLASELVAKGVGCVLIKLPPREVFMVDRYDTTHVPWFNLDIVDQTASRDAFAGALAASYAVGDEPKAAVRFACAAGALAMAKFGAQDSLPKKTKIIELLQQQPD